MSIKKIEYMMDITDTWFVPHFVKSILWNIWTEAIIQELLGKEKE